MQAVRHTKASTSGLAGQGGKNGNKSAVAFIFCAQGSMAMVCERLSLETAFIKPVDDTNDQDRECRRTDSVRFDSIAGVRLPPFEYMNLGLLLPAAFASHAGLLMSGGAACACLPIMAPFAVPQVSPDSWMANKRARAFHRCVVLGVYTQCGLALLKFTSGDLVGGTYLALQAAMGAYAISPDGTRFMPSYMMVSGFNGVLGIIQVFQSFQGVPLHLIPVMAALPPVLSLLTCYWGWQFCRELRAIGSGMAEDGPQDTCWVKFMGGDIWPISTLSPSPEPSARDERESVIGAGGGSVNRFAAFGGSGQRLGEQPTTY